MSQTAAFCRQQEAAQRLRAASEPLANVRQIALTAAAAWGAEALWAERREKKDAVNDPMRLSAQEQEEDRLSLEQGKA
jgi:hypothetical protein